MPKKPARPCAAAVVRLPTAMTPAQRALAPRQHDTDMPFEDVLRLVGGSAANGDNSDPVILEGEPLRVAQKWCERYGFSRLPATYGELMGMYDYCQELEVLSGFDSVAPHLLPTWQAASLKMQAKVDPEKFEPLKLYIQQDIEALRALHDREDTLTKLGRSYSEFSHDYVDE